jgi:hypothetical protein
MERRIFNEAKGAWPALSMLVAHLSCLRYMNMDYMFFSALQHVTAPFKLVSYDIACQWSKNLPRRALAAPHGLKLEIDNTTRYAIPKFHAPAHGPQCQSKYSLNFLRDVGRTYGEGVESIWAHLNGTAVSTREMSPAFRHETLNAHFSAWNWSKILGLGTYFSMKLDEAKKQAGIQDEALQDFEEALAPEHVAEWAEWVNDWDNGLTRSDPFAEPEGGE